MTELFVPAADVEEAKAKAESLQSIEIGEIDLQWVQVLAEGWASPLTGNSPLVRILTKIFTYKIIVFRKMISSIISSFQYYFDFTSFFCIVLFCNF